MTEFSPIRGYHHITMCVGSAQEDYDFHVKVLGLRLIKKTVLLDGVDPFYHLYYGNEAGNEGTLVTTFPMAWRNAGVLGSGQVRILSLAVPRGSFPYWVERLQRFGYPTTMAERLGVARLGFTHPCGVEYEFVETDEAPVGVWTKGGVPVTAAIQGMWSVAISTRDLPQFAAFLTEGMGFENQGPDGRETRFMVGEGKARRMLEVLYEPDRAQGSWGYSPGTVHHIAFDLPGLSIQETLKGHLEAQGYVDVSEVKDRNYFKSIYVRTPSGALFEAAVTHEKGWLKDETWETLGRELKFPPRMEDRQTQMAAKLEPIVE